MTQRYYSLDVFRGATVALMILVNNPGSWEHIYAPLGHAPWHGATPTDLVFPFFLFATGNAMAFVMPRMQQAGTAYFLRKLFKRTLLIFVIGLLLNWSPFLYWHNNELVFKSWIWFDNSNAPHGIRIMGVLQRIALAYCLAGLAVYFFKPKGVYVLAAATLLLYWFACFALGDKADPYSIHGFVGTYIDKAVIGQLHMYRGEGTAFDPEGLFGTFTAAVQVILGFMVGRYIQQKGKTHEMLSHLFVYATLLVLCGLLWDMAFPINKKLWTGSYVLYSTGIAVFALCIFVFLIEFKGRKGAWSHFFDVFGKNPLFIFVLSGFLPRVLGLIRISSISESGQPIYVSPLWWFYEHICKNIYKDLRLGSLVYAICMVIFYWFIAYLLDKKKAYIKV